MSAPEHVQGRAYWYAPRDGSAPVHLGEVRGTDRGRRDEVVRLHHTDSPATARAWRRDLERGFTPRTEPPEPVTAPTAPPPLPSNPD